MKGLSRVERKHSKKRDAVLKAIRSTQSHPGAQWIYDTLKPVIPSLSLGTVYRNINVFLEEGSVVSVGVVGGEERFDGRVSPHPHLICCRCGKIVDLPRPPDAGRPQETEADGLPEGFVVDYRKTVYYGLCGECTAASASMDQAGS
ncbi:MAG: transcriptional repressor [Spirochaetaceae bacterium]|nr:transcriptional repressor [Spirochaetaceae bacterium]